MEIGGFLFTGLFVSCVTMDRLVHSIPFHVKVY